jgi:beta-glucosidase
VVQVYFAPAERDQPIRLAGWTAVTVAAGESARVTVTTDRRMWRRWDEQANTWDRLGTGGEFLIARGLGDVRATLPVR